MKFKPLKYEKLATYHLYERKSKVNIANFSHTLGKDVIDFFPNILAGKDFKEIINKCVNAYYENKKIILSIGAHVIKVGLAPIFKLLFERKVISHIAMNGACIIHDVEIAINGATSEEVEEGIKCGNFGMSEETGRLINNAINEGFKKGIGLGEAIGEWLYKSGFKYKEFSLIYNAYKNDIPITVHVSIGTDIIHMHPNCRGDAIGETSLKDFKIFCNSIKDLSGGVYFNIGSAVIMPEVFLKAITLVRNLGYKVKNFITVNLDFIKHYRPLQNVVRRPVIDSGKGYYLIGHHEIMIPLIFISILNKIKREAGGDGL